MNTAEKKGEFQPYISADKVVPEFTIVSIIIGVALAILFGAANAYLGLRVGMTVSASIPAAVLSMGIIRFILKRESILENNMVQTIGSAGESLAAGAIFTLPAIFMWAAEDSSFSKPDYLVVAIVAICGGILGLIFMIPLRKALIVKEHGVLPYPEGTACAEVLIAGEEGGAKAGTVFAGLGIAAVYKFIADGLKVFPSEVDYGINKLPGSGIGVDVLPALGGVGYIIGIRVAGYLMAGATLSWFVIMPLIKVFGGDTVLYPADMPVGEMGPWDIWDNYIRYIGAGAVAAGGIISLIKSLPLIVKTFAESIKGFSLKSDATLDRTSQDLPMGVVAILLVLSIAVLVLVPSVPVGILSAILIVIFGFFFATVSSRMVGVVGSSNNPVSGMAIATLLVSTIVLKSSGMKGPEGMVAAIMLGTIICIIASMAGDLSQDLKTGYIVGATPKRQQVGELIGVIASGLVIALVLELLNNSFGYGTKELPAPQATLMKLVIEGVMGSNLPWGLVFCGVFIAVAMEFLKIPVLPVAIGVYLPIHLNTPIFLGALIRTYFEKRFEKDEDKKTKTVTSGILYSSGLIAGEGIVGILLAVFAAIKFGGGTLGDAINLSKNVNLGNIGGLIAFAIILLTIYLFAAKGLKQNKK